MTNINKLLAVQEYDLRIDGIQRELQDIPKRKEEELVRLDEHTKALERANEALKAKQADIHQLELEVDSTKEKISKLRQQQLDIKTNKEFRASETEIAGLENKIRGYEDSELVLLESLESLRSEVTARQKDLSEEERAVAADVEVLDGRSAVLEEEIRTNQQKRDIAAAEITDDGWLERYNAIRPARGTAVVRLEDGVCGGCHMKLPPSAVHDVHKSNTITSCDYCHRLLY